MCARAENPYYTLDSGRSEFYHGFVALAAGERAPVLSRADVLRAAAMPEVVLPGAASDDEAAPEPAPALTPPVSPVAV